MPPEKKTAARLDILAAMRGAGHEAIVLPHSGDGGPEPDIIRIEIFFYPSEEAAGPALIPGIEKLLTDKLAKMVKIDRDHGPNRPKRSQELPVNFDQFFS